MKTTALALALILLAAVAGAEDTLFAGETLAAGQYLERLPYRFIMQTDCNMVLYVNGSKALWSSDTSGDGTACKATLKSNGNLVILSGAGNNVWSSDSAQGVNNYRLVLQGDGNVVIYGAALWDTDTAQ